MRVSWPAKSRARSAPSASVTRRIVPRGDSNGSSCNCMAGFLCEGDFFDVGGPDVHQGVGAPGAPAFGAGQQFGGGGAAVVDFQAALEGDVAGKEGVSFGHAAHGDVVSGPFADAGEFAEAFDGLGEVATGVEEVWV